MAMTLYQRTCAKHITSFRFSERIELSLQRVRSNEPKPSGKGLHTTLTTLTPTEQTRLGVELQRIELPKLDLFPSQRSHHRVVGA